MTQRSAFLFLLLRPLAIAQQPIIRECPPIFPANQTFALPAPLSTSSGNYWVPSVAISAGQVDGGGGLELADMNGDSLVDLLFSIYDEGSRPSEYFQCVYLNTGCGWSKCESF